MATPREVRISFESDGLRLEGAMREGDGDITAIVCHPHPQYGGDMDSYVVMALCRVLSALGATAVRFNFRGAGASEGEHSGGVGEARDVEACAEYARGVRPSDRLTLCGYSFGAGVALAAASTVAPDLMVLVSMPGAMAGWAALPDGVPVLVITGEHDEIAPPAKLASLAGGGVTVTTVAGADHFWMPGIDRLTAAVESFVSEHLSPAR